MHPFLYLKECLRLVIHYLAGTPIHGFVPGQIMVRKDRWGLPVIIPKFLRVVIRLYRCLLVNKDIFGNQFLEYNNVITCILSLLSIFRVLPTKVKPTLDTIVAPFNGIAKSIDSATLAKALKELPQFIWHDFAPKLLLLETAGPNGFKSTWTCMLDIIAFIHNPSVFIAFYFYAVRIHRAYWLVLWLTFLCIVFLPLVIVKGLGDKFSIGKLSIVLDQAGKARVIAVCSWWVQVLFKPLHDAIFLVLKRIPQDGTFDQLAPITLLMKSQTRGETFYSYDLSAATDRLPIDLQIDILNLVLPNLGTYWGNLFKSIAYRYEGLLVKYSVGQPMGAFSSWGMLALTHHICVRVAALRVGITNFHDYAVLGDDIVIAHDAVAGSYLSLMESLGLSINLSKSLCSSLFLEFAKKWVGPGVNLTPIAPGLILRTVRAKLYISTLISEAFKLNILSSFSEALLKLSQLPPFYKGQLNNSLWTVCGLSLTLLTGSHADFGKIAWCFSYHENEFLKFKFTLYKALMVLRTERLNANKADLLASLSFFTENFWKSNLSKDLFIRIVESVARLISPAYWVYVHVLTVNASLLEDKINTIPWVPRNLDRAIIDLLKEIGPLNIATIDWRERDRVREAKFYAERLKLTIYYQVEYGHNFFVKDSPTMVRPIKEVPLGDDKWDGNFF